MSLSKPPSARGKKLSAAITAANAKSTNTPGTANGAGDDGSDPGAMADEDGDSNAGDGQDEDDELSFGKDETEDLFGAVETADSEGVKVI